MPTGTVKWFELGKGYGFITPDEGGQDVYVHATEVIRSGLRCLYRDQKVSYEIKKYRGKPNAINIEELD